MKHILLMFMVLAFLSLVGCREEVPVPEVPVPLLGAVVAPLAEEEVPLMYEVRILGKAGFDRPELKIFAGDGVTWINQDKDKRSVELVLQKDKSRKFITSPVFKVGEEYRHSFNEIGTYEFWTVGYGVKGKVVVQ